MIELRQYQVEVINTYNDRVAAGVKRIIMVAPTGSGKTVIGAEIIRTAARAAKNVMVLAHRREIISQTSQKLHDAGISHGIIQAGFQPRPLGAMLGEISIADACQRRRSPHR
jgi:DNA repair protein RadD